MSYIIAIFLFVTALYSEKIYSAAQDSLLHQAILMRGLYYISSDQKSKYFSDIEHIISSVNINSFDALGNTPLIKAVSGCDIDLVQLLIKNGADVNQGSNKFKTTPIMSTIYSMSGYQRARVSHPWLFCKNYVGQLEDIALLLITHRADIYKKNKFGRTSLDLAELYDLSEYAAFLKKTASEENSSDEDFVIIN